MAIEPYGDNFIPIVPVDEPEHTPEMPFCYDPACDCHEDQDSIGLVAHNVTDGLLTPDEATDFVAGRKV